MDQLSKNHKTFKTFNLWYVLALSGIALISIVSQVLIQKHLSNQVNNSHIINYAAKLRTYSQSISKTALLLEKGADIENNRKEFVNSLKQWQVLHRALLQGNDFLNLPANDREELAHMFQAVQGPFETIEKAANHIVDETYSSKPFTEMQLAPDVSKILENEKAYLTGMEIIVFDCDRFSQNSITNLKKIEYWILAFILVMLFFEALFIFHPLSKKLREIISGLTESRTFAVDLANKLKEANESLESSIKELRDTSYALEKATYMVRTDAEGRILYANDKYCHVTRYTMSELKTKPLFYNSFGGTESIIYDHIRNKERQKEVWQGEIRDHASDGTNFWLDVTLMPIIDNKGRLYQYLMVSNDITKKKHTEHKLQVLMQEQMNIKQMEQKIKSYSIIAGQEKERKRVAAEIHDGIGQMLTSMRMRLEMFVTARPDIQNEIGGIDKLLKTIIDETRKICSNLLPSVLDDFGLKAALTELFKSVEAETGIAIKVNDNLNPHFLDKEVEVGVFRILQESLNNVAKHSEAKSVHINMQNSKELLNLSIHDDGRGFDYEEGKLYVQDMAKKNNGLRIMKERAEMIGGELWIVSKKEKGTTINLEIAL